MAKRATLKLDTGVFDDMIVKLDELGGDVKAVVTDALEQVGETIGEDTLDAIRKSNLPAKGKYSKGDTKKSVIQRPKVIWEGTEASIGVGFDYSKPGAGGYLITGTPRMKPDRELNSMYKGKKYMKYIQESISDVIDDAITDRLEG